jgi:RNA polymerase sigma-70 factor, ECF subfamily
MTCISATADQTIPSGFVLSQPLGELARANRRFSAQKREGEHTVMAKADERPRSALDFETYVVPEIDLLHRVAYSLTGHAADAEDLVQETLLHAYRGIGGFDGAYPRAWLLTIMRNAQINRARRRRPELLTEQDSDFDRHAPTDTAGWPSPEAQVMAGTFDGAVSDALAGLPRRFRDAVVLVDVDGLSYAEAAQALGVPVGTVMSRLHRARTRMREQLAAAGLAPRRK